LPTFPEALRTVRDAFIRIEHLYIPDRLKREVKPGQGEGLVIGLAIGFGLALLVLLIVLKSAGVISS
jgi:hypothetical protein